MLNRNRLRGRAFTLIELLVVIAVIAILVSILLPALSQAKKTSKQTICWSNMNQFGLSMQEYATDFKDALYSFTWKPGIQYCDEFPAAGVTPGSPLGQLQAARDQAVHILNERGRFAPYPRITAGWFPHARYGHLVINEYLQQRLPEKMVVCPEDLPQLAWQDTNIGVSSYAEMITAFLALPFSLRPSTATGDQAERLPYASSYFQGACEWSQDVSRNGTDICWQDTGVPHYSFWFSGTSPVKERRLSDVQFPSDKVYLAEDFGRHFTKSPTYYAYPDSKVPGCFFDRSVRTIRTGSGNYGFYPPLPTIYSYQAGVTHYNYTPQSYEPPARLPGNPGTDIVDGFYRWTRAGLRGRDTNGREVASGGNPPPGGGGGP